MRTVGGGAVPPPVFVGEYGVAPLPDGGVGAWPGEVDSGDLGADAAGEPADVDAGGLPDSGCGHEGLTSDEGGDPARAPAADVPNGRFLTFQPSGAVLLMVWS